MLFILLFFLIFFFFSPINGQVTFFSQAKQAVKEADDSCKYFSEEFKCQVYKIGNKYNTGSSISSDKLFFHYSYGLGTWNINFIILTKAF